ncbi:MAG: selenium metabolism-associated LysR family transcriptional regulator [Pseudomonadota bacterium]
MNLWQLHIFCKVIELKSFSRTGEVIHLSQPTISTHIKDLENYFECRLIDRMGKQALPTRAGELLYGYARRLLLLSEETKSAVAAFNGKLSGRLVIGGSTIPGAYLLPKVIGEFTKQYKDITVSISISDTKKIVEDTQKGLIEFGIVGGKSSAKGIVQEKLMEDEMCLVVPSDHRWASRKSVTVSMLQKEPFLIREQGSGTLSSLKNSLSLNHIDFQSFHIVAEMGSTTAVIQGIKNRIGVSILSPIAIQEELQTGSLSALSVDGLDLKRSFYLTRHGQRTPSPIAHTFIRFLHETVASSGSS